MTAKGRVRSQPEASDAAPAGRVDPGAARAQLDRVLGSPDLRNSRQLSSFLRFVVEETLAGREATLKERTIAIGALGRDKSFDPRLDAIVRIAAGKLRRALDRYDHTEGADDAFRIVIPKGSYVPTFPRRADATSSVAESTPATDLVLRTKLHRPPTPLDLVRPSELIESLTLHHDQPFTLVSAPAGYGKSTLLSAWLGETGLPGAWLSLDEDDNDPRQFLLGVVLAVRSIHPGAAAATEALLTTTNLPSPRVLGRQLLNDLDELDGETVLVLDDYHAIESSAIHEVVTQIIEYPPQGLRLVILTRTEPPLPLDRLRGRGQLLQLSLFDLRFSSHHTKVFLERTLGIRVTDSMAEAVAGRLEGWPAGLRLLAFSLRGQRDTAGALHRLEGDLHAVTGYLMSEVLAQTPPPVTDCLLRMSMVDQFCERLCEMLCDPSPGTCEQSGRTLIDWLSERNLFLIPLDAEARWFRFHHLFRDLLRLEAERRLGQDQITEIHTRAAAWFETEGRIDDAIHHALLAGDEPLAADIVERARVAELDRDRWHLISRWIDMLPDHLIRSRPALLLGRAWVLGDQFRLQEIPPILERADALLDGDTATPELLGELDYHCGCMLFWSGEPEAACRRLLRASERVPSSHQLIASEIQFHLALARHAVGDGAVAVASLAERIDAADPSESVLLSRLRLARVFVHLLSGDLASALAESERFKARMEGLGGHYALAWTHYLHGLPLIHRLELDGAGAEFELAAADRQILHLQASTDAMAGLVLAHALARRADAASEAMVDLLSFTRDRESPDHLAVAESCRARLSLHAGEEESALAWARMTDAAPDVPSMVCWLEIPALTRLRVLATGGTRAEVEQALDSLRTLRVRVESSHNTCQAIEIAVLEAVALHRLNRTSEALDAVDHALDLAEPSGWIRPFIEAGPSIADLLGTLTKRRPDAAHIERLLAAFDLGARGA